MTTTELINLLAAYEFGGGTHRPRIVVFEINGKCVETDGVKVVGAEDGLFTHLYLSLPAAEHTGKWIADGRRIPYGCLWMHCSACGAQDIDTPDTRTPYCPNCGAKMEGEADE